MSNNRLYLTCFVAAVAAASIPLSFVGPGGLRLAVVGMFLLAGPGTALVMLLRINPTASQRRTEMLPLTVAIAIGSSLAISALVATAMLYAHLWNPALAVSCLSLLTLGMLVLALRRERVLEVAR
ncbi:MAG TPA: hypothetical protein VLI70_09870 [Micrococcaceae bacterium]|jgi:hypothetical protein|nr:hypothetical protein [Micrococcaceae bacterium]